MALKAGIHEIYLIDKKNVVRYTSFPKDLNLDFNQISSTMPPYLKKIRSEEKPVHQQISQSMLTGKFAQYSYYYLKKTGYILELGVWVDQYLDEKYSPDYRKKLLNDLFVNELLYSDYVKKIMVSTSDHYSEITLKKLKEKKFNSRGLRDLITLKKIPYINFELYSNVLKEKEISIQKGKLKNVFSYISIPEPFRTFYRQQFILYVAYDFSVLTQRQKRILATIILTVIVVFIIVFIISISYLKNGVLSKILKINSTIGNISKGDYSKELHLAGNDELSSIAEHVNCMKENIQKREEELTQTKKILQTSLDQSPLSIIIIGADSKKILYSNQLQPEIQNYLDINMEYICNEKEKSQKTILYPDKRPYDLKDLPISEVLFNSKTIKNMELLIKKGDSSELWSLINAAPIHNKNGDLVAAIILCQDITDEKKAEAAMIQAQKMEIMGVMASGIAHDFNNIMSGIIGGLSVIKINLFKLNLFENDKFSRNWERTQRLCNSAVELIKQLLNFSKKGESQLRIIDLKSLIENVIFLSQSSLSKKIEVKTFFPEKPILVKVDKIQLEQVLLNLCINAGHAMTIMRKEDVSQGGVLSLKLKFLENYDNFLKFHSGTKHQHYCLIEVADTGVGMDEKTIENIFTPFFSTKDEKGTGLGLSMVYSIIQNHNGFIDVESTPGKGSNFKIYLPTHFFKAHSTTGKKEV